MKYNLILMGLLLPTSSLSFAADSDSIKQTLMSTQSYQESCYFEPKVNETFNLLDCDNYAFINVANLSDTERTKVSSSIFGLGTSSPYILINSPNDLNHRVFTSLEFFDRDILIDLVNNSNLTSPNIDIAENSRSRRSINNDTDLATTSTQDATKYSWRFREIFRLNRSFYPTKDDIAILDYEVETISKRPAYSPDSGADNPKFVRVTLVGGTGINFNPTESQSYKQLDTKHSHQVSLYSYREYLDKVKISTSWNDNKAQLTDWFPRNNDKDRTGVTYESSFSVGFALNIPKLPIKEVTIDSSKKLTFENGNYFDYDAHSKTYSHSVEYKNKEFGSSFSKHTGYCNLLGPAKGCWRTVYDMQPPFQAFDLLRNTPYSNGFVPDYSVTYQANRNTTGTSTLSITTDIKGLSLQGVTEWSIGSRYWSGVNSVDGYGDDYKTKTYKHSLKLAVNWDSPIFSGAEPSVITFPYLSDETAHCFTVGSNRFVNIEPCNPAKTNQLFIYTPEFKYVYSNDKSLCLDSSQNKLMLKECNIYANNSQRWSWFTQPLGHNLYDNTLLYTTKSSGGFKVINHHDTNNNLALSETESLDEAYNRWPESRLNTQSGRYLSAITKLN